MASITSPLTHAQFDGGAIQARNAFLLGAIRSRLVEQVSLRQFIRYGGSLAKLGSDVLRETFYDGIGWDAVMTSLTEVQDISSLSGLTAEIEDISIGRYGIGYSESYQNRILQRNGEINLALLAQLMPNAWEGNFMNILASVLAGAAADFGSSGVDMSFDDYLDMVFYFRTLDGFGFYAEDGSPNLIGMLHGQQLIDLANSVRAEPNYQFPEPTDKMLAGKGAGYQFDWLGASVWQSNRVTAAGGNRHGGFFGKGSIAWAQGGTEDIQVENPATAIIVPELGMVTEFKGVPNTASMEMYSNVWVGMAIQDDSQVRGMVTDQ